MVQSRSPLELVVMLYDGVTRFLNEAKSAVEARDLVTKRHAISRALAIISELQSSLNFAEGGDIAVKLDGLYTHMNGRLLEANMHIDAAPIDEVLELLVPLRESWSAIGAEAAQTEAGAQV
jgi:flagellar protein FliS